MKAKKIIILTILCAIPVFVLVFRAQVYNSFVYYNLNTMKTIAPLKNESKQTQVEAETKGLSDVQLIAKKCLGITTKQLDVKLEVLPVDPNELATSNTANPIGMSAYLTSLCNHALKYNELDGVWLARTAKCDVEFLTIDLAKLMQNEHYKGHDIVVIENQKSGERIGIDPIVSEYFRIDQISL